MDLPATVIYALHWSLRHQSLLETFEEAMESEGFKHLMGTGQAESSIPTSFIEHVFIRLVDVDEDNFVTQKELFATQIKAREYAEEKEMDTIPYDWPTMLEAIYYGYDWPQVLRSHQQCKQIAPQHQQALPPPSCENPQILNPLPSFHRQRSLRNTVMIEDMTLLQKLGAWMQVCFKITCLNPFFLIND